MQIVHIVDIDEVPAFFSGSVNNGALPLKHPDDKGAHNRRDHSAPILSRSVDIEIAHDGRIYPVKLPVTFTECGPAVFTRGVDADRPNPFFRSGKLIDALILGGSVRGHELAHFR